MSTEHIKTTEFVTLFDHHSSELFSFCHSRIKDYRIAESIVVNTYASLWQFFGNQFCSFEDTRGTLFQAVFLLCDNYANNPDPQLLLAPKDKLDTTPFLDQLPSTEKQVFDLFYFKKHTLTQVAGNLSLPISIIKKYKLNAETDLTRAIYHSSI